MFKLQNRMLPLLIGLLLAVVSAGCGPDGKATVEVTGKVTFKGAPVTEGQVTFLAEDGYSATAELDSSGKFTIETLQVGKYTVSVNPPALTEAPSEDPSKMGKPKQYKNIPQGYRNETTSDLTAEVTADGENNFTFDMKPGGGKQQNRQQQAP